jgi:hypothetical protein
VGSGGLEVPLSEDDERMLHEIERQFYASDPDSYRRIGQTTLTRHLARNCRWAALGFLFGLVVLVISFASSWVIAVFGFVIMLGSAIVFTQNLRKLGRHGWQQITQSMKGSSFADKLSDARRRWRERFGGDDGTP